MMGPKKSATTIAHAADLAALSQMQIDCQCGKVTEAAYNAHREVEAARLIALGVETAFIAAKVINGRPTL
jgi:hypothetical protein